MEHRFKARDELVNTWRETQRAELGLAGSEKKRRMLYCEEYRDLDFLFC